MRPYTRHMWTITEIRTLVAMKLSKCKNRDIAARIGVTYSAVMEKWYKRREDRAVTQILAEVEKVPHLSPETTTN